MLAGRLFRGKVRCRVSIDVTSLSASGATAGASYDCYLRTWYIGLFGALQPGITLRINSAKDAPTDSYNFEIESPLLGISDSMTGASWEAAIESIVTIPVDVYQDASARWYCVFGEVSWSCNGTTRTYSAIGGHLSYVTMPPSWLPIFGTPVAISPDFSAFPTDLPGDCTEYTASASGTAVVLGGYQIWDDDAPAPAWESLPIYWPPVDDPGVSGAPFGLDLSGITRGTDTWTAGLNLTCENRSVNSRFRDTNYRNQDGETRSGWFWVVPDLDRSVVRATGDDYAAMIARYGLPKVEQLGDHGWGESSNVPTRPEDLTNYEDSRTDLLPLETQQLATVISATHIIEAPLSADALHLPMIYAVGHHKSELHGPGIAGTGSCSDNGIDPPAYEANIGESVAYRSMLQTSYNAAGELDWFDFDEGGATFLNRTSFGDFDGKDSVVRFWQNWAHALWLYWYQPNDLMVDGGSVDWEDYSYPLGQQWLMDSSLSGVDRRYTRTDLISMQGIEGGNSAPGQVIESNISGADHPSSWWGNWGYETDQWVLPASIQTDADSEDRWTIEDSGAAPLTATFGGSDISVTIGTGDVIALFELASFADEPYLYPSIAQRFEVLRDSATVDRIRCYLVGADGSEVELNETDVQAAGGANWPATGLLSTEYVGTWGRIDYGQSVVSDSPADLLGSGESAAAMTDRVRCTIPQLLPGRTAKYLKIVATPKAATDPIKLKYPKFFAPTLAPEVRYLGRQMAAVIWPDGPGIVLGNWRFWDYTLDTFLSTPEIRGIGSKTSVMDALCARNLFEGKVADDGLDAKIGALYDEDIEFAAGTERIQCAYNTIAWWVISEDKVAACLQNCYIPPPLAWFPPRQRDSDYLLATDRALEVVDWCQEPRLLITPENDEVGLYQDPSDHWTVDTVLTVDGWRIRKHEHPVTNSEAEADFHIRNQISLVDLTDLRPWHGWFAVLGIEAPSVENRPSYDISPARRHAIAWIADGTIHLHFGPNLLPQSVVGTDTGIAADAVCIRWEKRASTERLWLVYESGGNIIRSSTSNEGASFSSTMTVASGAVPAFEASEHGTFYVYWRDGSDIKGKKFEPDFATAIGSVFTVHAGVSGTTTFDVREAVIGQGDWRMGLVYVDGSSSIVLESAPDGQTFS